MKRNLFKLLPLVLALSCGAVGTASAQYWGDQPYDEQQWWNPADWGTWDSTYNWGDNNEWYGEDGLGAGSSPYDYDYGYGTDIGSDSDVGLDSDYGSEGLYNDEWGFDWNEEFD